MLVVKLFFADWCSNCVSFHPTYEKIVKTVMSDNKLNRKVKFEKFDIDQNRSLAKELNIEGIPTIILYFNGKNYKYTGERNVEHIVRKIRKICDEYIK